MDREQLIEECRQKCTCRDYRDKKLQQQQQRPSQSSAADDDGYNQDQRTFISFLTETISVIAFIVFGSVVFWLAVGGILFDFIRRLYYSDRYVKIFIAVLFSCLFLSMSLRLYLNKKACREHFLLIQREQERRNAKDGQADQATVTITKTTVPAPPAHPPEPPPPEYLKIQLKDDQLRHLTEEHEKMLTKKFTLSIMNEKKQEVFKTTKTFLIPHEAMNNENKPSLLFYLKEITLEDY